MNASAVHNNKCPNLHIKMLIFSWVVMVLVPDRLIDEEHKWIDCRGALRMVGENIMTNHLANVREKDGFERANDWPATYCEDVQSFVFLRT
jgi:hypothetical protein